jgi:hypothetical protein
MSSVLLTQTVVSVMTVLLLIGGRPGRASEQPGSVVTRSVRPHPSPITRIDQGAAKGRGPVWPLDSHVRSSDDRFLNVLRDGVARSVTFRDLIGALNRSDVIVYVEPRPRMRAGISAYLVHQVVTAGNYRYVKVMVNRELTRDRLTGVIAHELQHSREVADAADVRSSVDMRALFTRLDSGKCVWIRRCTETDAAVRLEAAVLAELTAGR